MKARSATPKTPLISSDVGEQRHYTALLRNGKITEQAAHKAGLKPVLVFHGLEKPLVRALCTNANGEWFAATGKRIKPLTLAESWDFRCDGNWKDDCDVIDHDELCKHDRAILGALQFLEAPGRFIGWDVAACANAATTPSGYMDCAKFRKLCAALPKRN